MSKSEITIRRKSDGKVLKDIINDSCQVHNIYDGDTLVASEKDSTIGYIEGSGFCDWSDYEEIWRKNDAQKFFDSLENVSEYNKNLLVADLGIRIPYNVVCHISQHVNGGDLETDDILRAVYKEGVCEFDQAIGFDFGDFNVETDVRPYLRPMCSMTESEYKQMKEETVHNDLYGSVFKYDLTAYQIAAQIKWLAMRHFDFNDLIGRGLAIKVTEDNNPYKDEKGR